ncbi:MAG: GAF domain-containing protein, partial [Candidatus Sericytochromatia bacterium]
LEAVRPEAAGADMLEAALCLGLSRLAAARGDLAEARLQAERGLTFARAASWVLGQADLLGALGTAAVAMGEPEAAEAAYDAMLLAADMMNCPHHRAIALSGLAELAEGAAGASALTARAAENLNVYLEQLSDVGREDFMRLAERRRALALSDAAPSPGEPPARPASRKPAEEPEGPRLEDLLGTIHPGLPLDEVAARLAEALMKLSHASRTMVYLYNEEGELKLRQRLEAQDRLSVLGRDEACHWLLQRAVGAGETLWVADAARDPEYAELPEVRQQGLRGLMAIPLVAVDASGERVIGCLYGDSQAPWLGVSERAVRILEHLARYAGVVLEVGLLQDESNRKAHRLEMLNQLSRVIAGTLDLDKLLTLALGQILQITQGEEGYVFFGDGLACRASMDRQGRKLSEVHVSQGVIARVQRERQPLAILDVGLDSELQSRESLMARKVQSVMCVPLQADDQLVGLIYISSPTANRTFTRTDLDLMTAISAQVALALQNAQAYETIKGLNVGLEEKVKERTAELTTAYQELKETQEQLVEKEKLATIGTLAAGVAHEINNPLGAILTNAQLIGLDVDDPEILDSLALIEEGARRCKEVVSALLRYSKEDRTNHHPVDFKAIVAEGLALYERQLRDARIVVAAELDDVPLILGDLMDLREMMAHLVRNALDAIQARHGLAGGHLSLSLSSEGEGVVFLVTDDGAGMSHEVQRRIFDPFYTTKKVGSGQGLGLTVCQRVIEQHGGTITVRSGAGEGAAFRIVLPSAEYSVPSP